MANVMAAINLHLRNQAAIAALVSTRVYSLTLPQGITYPALVLTDVTTQHAEDFSGSSGWARAQIQIDAWATTYAAAAALAEAVRQELQLAADVSVAPDTGAVTIDGISVVADNTSALRPEAGSRDSLVRKSLTYGVSYRESIPA